MVDVSKLIPCFKDRKCFKGQDLFSLKKKNVILYDSRLYGGNLKNIHNLRKLNQFNIIGRPMTWREYKMVLYRLMTNPSPELTEVILRRREPLRPFDYLLGIHLRCGGQLADTPERSVMITWKQLQRIPDQICEIMQSLHKRVTIYLSTDSTKAEEFIRKSLKNVTIVTLDGYRRGHTEMNAVSDDSIKRAIVDMYLVAQAKQIVITSKSGFSAAISALGNPNHQFFIHSSLK